MCSYNVPNASLPLKTSQIGRWPFGLDQSIQIGRKRSAEIIEPRNYEGEEDPAGTSLAVKSVSSLISPKPLGGPMLHRAVLNFGNILTIVQAYRTVLNQDKMLGKYLSEAKVACGAMKKVVTDLDKTKEPEQFGPYDLLDDQTPLLLEPHHNGLFLTPLISDDNRENRQNLSNGFSDHNLCNGVINNSVYNSALLNAAAMEAANESHAPYTNCPSGVALMDCEGKVYKGSYAESAAYNPTLGPFQAALIAFVAGGGGGYDRIVAAALVEKEEAKVKQEDTARLLLKAVSPKCELKVFHCSSSANFCKKATN
nr:cytidine deaminase 1-like [Ipomoea batatas]